MGTQKTISFRMNADKVEALDSIASHVQRDRTFLLNEAVDAYLDLSAYHQQLILEGIEDAKAGRYVDNNEMRRRLAKLGKKRKTA